mmetsp:Transcript_36674/g.92193  ORF Transcript_36674/g.92193 Transcript_36674/m.92193 type:complete len:152 (+) Transcript_36674:50-505(+)
MHGEDGQGCEEHVGAFLGVLGAGGRGGAEWRALSAAGLILTMTGSGAFVNPAEYENPFAESVHLARVIDCWMNHVEGTGEKLLYELQQNISGACKEWLWVTWRATTWRGRCWTPVQLTYSRSSGSPLTPPESSDYVSGCQSFSLDQAVQPS